MEGPESLGLPRRSGEQLSHYPPGIQRPCIAPSACMLGYSGCERSLNVPYCTKGKKGIIWGPESHVIFVYKAVILLDSVGISQSPLCGHLHERTQQTRTNAGKACTVMRPTPRRGHKHPRNLGYGDGLGSIQAYACTISSPKLHLSLIRNFSPLAQEVAEWLDGAGEAGVVYFSLGSFQNASRIPQKYREALFKAFARLPHRVLVKFSDDGFELPPNVRSFTWLPQQDILGHKSIRVFITHCGKHSAAEALYHGVPILGLPITFDQPRTCARMARRQEGIVLQWEELTVETIVNSVYELTNNHKYRDRVVGVSRRMKAQKETGLNRAVWWVEYIIDHGKDYLRFSGAELSLSQYLLLDILGIIVVLTAIIGGIFIFLARSVLKVFWPSSLSKAILSTVFTYVVYNLLLLVLITSQ
ncbi:UDP-glucosyltransferase 2-like [Penaeus monodon]|uniref:UDP-glucosyltransferase 2-like n=1 Tax=Penaeus monodon TaxID=6687 RepID=UPI0018A746F8|nr:UDP-glucosyltransferase 2-like [Penaeus monodon]